MNNLRISRILFSEMFWSIMFSSSAAVNSKAKELLESRHAEIEALRGQAAYDTGSISIASSVVLCLITNYFRPKVIAEIGTFIGRSTYAAALGPTLSGFECPSIHTCDISNNININFDSILTNVIQYPKKSSTDMFSELLGQKLLPDIYLLDGRIQQADIPLLVQLSAEKAVFVLDDFEGTEKGVANAYTLQSAFKDKFLLVYPPTGGFLRSLGFSDFSSTAVMIPLSKIMFVNQS